MKGRVLIAAGSDSGGGAGIQADIKTVTALGGFAATAITALTAQDTRAVYDILDLSSDFVARQMEVVLDDIGADCIKTGMLHSSVIVDTVLDVMERKAPQLAMVVDPVMIAKSGAELLRPDTVKKVRDLLLPRATVLTPNTLEAQLLCGHSIRTVDDMEPAAAALLALGPKAVLLKGGHLDDPASKDEVVDLLATTSGMERLTSPRIDTTNTHGTGCTLASAIACGIAQGMTLRDAVGRARKYVWEAICTAPRLGHGHGPLNHSHPCIGYND